MAIETLNIDGKEMKVADLPETTQRLIAVYEETHNKRIEIENQHIALSAALRQLSTDISASIRAASEKSASEEAKEEVKAEIASVSQ